MAAATTTSTMAAAELPTPAAFAFPYAAGPYPIQLALMQHLYWTLEHGQVGLVQSPTGTVRPDLPPSLPPEDSPLF